MGFLEFDEKTIKSVSRERNDALAQIVLKQAYYENRLRIRKRLKFRHRENPNATRAYCSMTIQEFEGINARQRWANWRTVPRSLSGHLPSRPLKAVDMCCGSGHSTQVLAFYLPKGSEVLGLEYNPEFVKHAKAQSYIDRHGKKVKAEFRAQSVLETFRDHRGKPLPDRSIDLVSSCGAIGHHFTPEMMEKVACELKRILKPGGLATLDSGPHGTEPEQLTSILSNIGCRAVKSVKSCMIDLYTQILFIKE